MRDRRLKEIFEQQLEIPDVVQEKAYEVYRQVGADMKKAEKICDRNRQGKTGMRYLKAASFLLLAMIAATTVHAAANGGVEKLSRLFGGDVSQIQSSSVTPEISSEKSTFKDLKISVDRVFGTEELAYVILNVKRTDGKKFDKKVDYSFKQVGMKGENDTKWMKKELDDGTGAGGIVVIGEGKNGPEVVDVESVYTDTGIMIENNGTDEICLAVVCGYEQIKDGISRYHKGEKCQLKLMQLCGDVNGEQKECIDGTAETEFVLDYDDCQKKVCKPGKMVELPWMNSETDYLPIGTLDRVTVTPYFIRYEMTMDEEQSHNDDNTWDQIYLEMEDGSRVGYPTLDSWLGTDSRRESYGWGENGKFQKCMLLSELVDVEHVKAVYFGKTRIDMQG